MTKHLFRSLFLLLIASATHAGGSTSDGVPIDVLPFDLSAPALKSAPARPDNRFAEAFEHRITARSHGQWRTELRDGVEMSVWEYAARIPGAVSMSLHADKVALPGGAHLRVEGIHGRGESFYEGSLRGRSGLWTAAVAGDTLYITIEVPTDHADAVAFETRRFHAGFRVPATPMLKDTTTRNPDDNNYDCFAEPSNELLSRAAVHITIQGVTFCSAALINHPNADEDPYLLTAAHCADDYEDVPLQDVTESVVASFQKITPCNDTLFAVVADENSRRGVATVYRDALAEFTRDYWLLELESYPPAVVSPYLAGYEGVTNPMVGENGRAVHHQANTSQQWFDAAFSSRGELALTGPDDEPVRRSDYYTYVAPVGGGASGAAMYNEDDRIVAVISGGTDERTSASVLDDAMNAGLAAHFDGVLSLAGREAPAGVAPTVDVAPIAGGPFAVGDDYDVSWTSSGAEHCNATEDWSGPLALNGTRTVTAENTSAQQVAVRHTVSCTSDGGLTTTDTAVALVNPEPPTVDIAVSPTQIVAGDSAALSWASTLALDCSASGDWSGAKATSGDLSIGPISTPGTYTYTLDCENDAHSRSDSAVLEVVAPPDPVVLTLSAPATADVEADFQVTWDAADADACQATGAWSGAKATSGSQTFSFATAGERTFTLLCTGAGASDTASATVDVVAGAQPNVSIFAPREVDTGESFSVRWESDLVASCNASGAWSGAKATSGSQTFTFNTAGERTFTLSCTGPDGDDTASRTVSVVAPPPAPTLTLSAPSSVMVDEPINLNWNSPQADSCQASGAWGGSRPNQGSATRTFSTPGTRTFELTCENDTGEISRSVQVDVQPYPNVVITFTAPDQVELGDSYTVSWSAPAATECAATGDWSGSKATSGSQTFIASTLGRVFYGLACENPGDTTARTISVDVVEALPDPVSITMTATPQQVGLDETSSVQWIADHASSCSASGDWSGSRATQGSRTVRFSTPGTRTLTLTCQGAGGEATRSVTINVIDDTAAPAPEVTLTLDDAAILVGETTTLSWSSTNTTGTCTAGNAWTGARALSGSATITGNSAGTQSYRLECQNADGVVETATVTLQVLEPQDFAVDFTSSTDEVTSGQPITLLWSAPMADACMASGDWTSDGQFSYATTGSRQVTPIILGEAVYALTCRDASGREVDRTVTVMVRSNVQPSGSGDGGGAFGLGFLVLGALAIGVRSSRRRGAH